MSRSAFLLLLALPLIAAKGPKLPPDAPYCAQPGVRQLFVAPMGEPFRAASGQPYPAATWFAGADRNHDGEVDRVEFLGDARRFFQAIDLDHDGKLTPEEVAAYERDVAPEIALYSSRPQLGDPANPRRPESADLPHSRLGNAALSASEAPILPYGGAMGAGRYSWLNVPEPVVSADADVDRVVSAAEFNAAAGRRFDSLAQGRPSLKLADMAKTPAQAAIEGPCRPRPKPRKNRRGADFDRDLDREMPR